MCRWVDIPWVGRSKYHGLGGQYTMGKGVDIPVNGQKVTEQKVTGQKVTIYIFYPGGQKVTRQKVTTYIFA